MNNFKHIQTKLQQFIRKFYINELIKGLLLFFTIGLLYFLFTLFIEYLLWLKPFYRTVLFWLFVLVELALLVKYIFLPIFKLTGIKKGISEFEASKIIGKYFPEVSDKLLNMLQLKEFNENSELIEASIEQKSLELQPIPFVRAVDFNKNRKYLKYTVIPLLVWCVVYITGNINVFNDSFKRVIQHSTQFEQPAPFTFVILNKSLKVIEGESFFLEVEAVGMSIPEDVIINLSGESYYLESNGFGKFKYNFSAVKENITFSLNSGNVFSKEYKLSVIPTPVISGLKMELKYPAYTGKSDEVLKNTGNAVVPQGTKVTWRIETEKTEKISIKGFDGEELNFNPISKNLFSFSQNLMSTFKYGISTSNKQIVNHESINFSIDVISDEFPKIFVKSDIDSISHGPVQFIGQLSDDYAIDKLQLVYYNVNQPKLLIKHIIPVTKSSFTDFYYVFPEGLSIQEGVEYEMYFEVFDNDGVNGSKKSKSTVFSYYNKTSNELNDLLLKEQKESLSKISNSVQKSKKASNDLKKLSEELQKKARMNWNDAKKLEEFLKRQNEYEKMIQDQTKDLQNNLKEQPVMESLKKKKKELEKRIEESRKMQEQEKLLEELKELTQKLEKENLVDKLKELTQKNKRNEQSLERILELTKRFYVEQKANQIKEKLEKVSKKEEELSKGELEDNTSKKQDELNKEFDEIENDFTDLNKQNKDLKRPIDLPNLGQERKEVNQLMDDALDKLNNNQKESAKNSQEKAAKKMKKMAESFNSAMEASEGESIDEDIDDLRKIVENLIEFSFQQENLMNSFNGKDTNHPEFPKNLKEQQKLKVYFEHIDDSLYVLSLSLVKMGNDIQKEVSQVHFNIDESLVSFTDNLIDQGISNQQFVITSANNLANSLSNLLESLMNASPSFGKGKGKSQEFSLPDIIKKQGDLLKKMKDGLKPGENSGANKGDKKGNSGNEGSESVNKELFEIYKEQAMLKEALDKILGKGSKNGNGNESLKQMEELENELLKRGLDENSINKMQQLLYELLKLEEAKKEQGEDDERKSETNLDLFDERLIKKLELQNQYFNYNEILNRQLLPLRSLYKKKVQEYFKTNPD